MRLKALLPELRVPARPAAQLAAIALCLGGCGTLDTASGVSNQFRYGGPTYRPSGPIYADPSKVYLRHTMVVELEREYMDRYMCTNDKPLFCQCYSRLNQTCDCHC